jgi:hypothetical protein
MIMLENAYDDRPDIVFAKGHCADGYPRKTLNGQLVEFIFHMHSNLDINGAFQVINTSTLPIDSKIPESTLTIPSAGIIECSINKTLEHATKQLSRYKNLFGSDNGIPLLLVTGNDLCIEEVESVRIRLSSNDVQIVREDLMHAGHTALHLFGLL